MTDLPGIVEEESEVKAVAWSDAAKASLPRLGLPVVTMDSHPIGRVTQVEGDSFRLSGGRSMWLRNDAIFTVSGGLIRLVCNETRLDEYARSERPGA